MKYITALFMTIIGLCFSSYGDANTTNIVVEIIEFDCISHLDEFNQYSKEFNSKQPIHDCTSLISKLKSSELPQNILLRHSQAFSLGKKSSQSINLDGTRFSLEVIPIENSNLVELKIDYLKPVGEFENSMRTNTILEPGTTKLLSTDFQLGEGGGEVTSRIIKISFATIEISG